MDHNLVLLHSFAPHFKTGQGLTLPDGYDHPYYTGSVLVYAINKATLPETSFIPAYKGLVF